MSYFATALNELIEGKNLTQAGLARRAGLPQPQISRWVNNPHQWISAGDFQRLCQVFDKPIEQANLIRARLLDIATTADVPGNRLIEIVIAGAPTKEVVTTYQTKLPPKIDRDIATIVEHVTKDRLVREMISSLAVHLRRKQ